MRVAFITHYSSLYGANRSLLSLIDGLSRFGVRAFVIGVEDGEIHKALDRRDVPFVVIPFHRWVGWRPRCTKLHQPLKAYTVWRKETIARLAGNLSASRTIARQLRQWDVDMVYTNSAVTPVGLMAARAVSLPHVWHLREFCDLHFNLKFDWGRNAFERYIGFSDAIISVSKAIESYYLARVESSRKRVIYNGVASREFINKLCPGKEPGPHDGRYRFLMLGAIQANKGHEEALQALAELKRQGFEVELIVAGEGEAAKLQENARELDVADRMDFRGYVDDPFAILCEADALLVCSRYEAMGRVTVEAMAAGRPVIGFNQAGTSELIQHEYNGLLYDGGPGELAKSMARFVHSPAWAARLGENGWRQARDKYNLERYAEEVFSVLSRLGPRRKSGLRQASC